MADQITRCPDERLNALVTSITADERAGMRQLDESLRAYPGDARLHFLKGSLLAGRQDYVGARAEMRRAVDLAPDYAVARFQLGFLLLTSAEPHAAQEAWGPLHALPADNFVRLFVEGLSALIHDRFSDTIRFLQEGIAQNRENVAMNRDMQLIIDQVRRKMDVSATGGEASSTVDLLLQQAAIKANKH
jgi:tetratricopeptide (TPR) repeat protein